MLFSLMPAAKVYVSRFHAKARRTLFIYKFSLSSLLPSFFSYRVPLLRVESVVSEEIRLEETLFGVRLIEFVRGLPFLPTLTKHQKDLLGKGGMGET